MKVSELIEKLKKYPEDAEVYVEEQGDHYKLGDNDVEYKEKEHRIII